MKNAKAIFKIVFVISVGLIISLLALLFSIDYSMNTKMTTVSLFDLEGRGADVKTYETDSDYTVVIVTENSTQQNRIKSLVRFFYDYNINIISFSLDNIGVSTLETFISQADDPSGINGGIPRDKTLLVGYGKGGNELISYLSDYQQGYMGLVLFSPYDMPSPISDEYLTTKTLILGTTSDDVASPEVLARLYNTLSGDDIRGTGFAFKAAKNNVNLRITSNAFNVYNAYSVDALRDLSLWLQTNFDMQGDINLATSSIRVYSWIFVIGALITMLISVYNISVRSVFNTSYSLVSGKDIFPPIYFTLKGLLLLGTVPVSAIIIAILWFTPLKMFIIQLCFGVYLLINAVGMYLVYRYSKLPIFDETNRFVAPKLSPNRIIKALCLSGFVVAVAVSLSYTGMFGLSFVGTRIFMFIILVILCGAGFYTAFYENLFLDEMKAHFITKSIFQAISYVPLIALAVISIPIAGFTALLNCIIYILALYIAVLLHRTVSHLTVNPLATCAITSIVYAGFLAFVVI